MELILRPFFSQLPCYQGRDHRYGWQSQRRHPLQRHAAGSHQDPPFQTQPCYRRLRFPRPTRQVGRPH